MGRRDWPTMGEDLANSKEEGLSNMEEDWANKGGGIGQQGGVLGQQGEYWPNREDWPTGGDWANREEERFGNGRRSNSAKWVIKIWPTWSRNIGLTGWRDWATARRRWGWATRKRLHY